jgi:hypothetical protein
MRMLTYAELYQLPLASCFNHGNWDCDLQCNLFRLNKICKMNKLCVH